MKKKNKVKICFLASSYSWHSQSWINYFVESGYEVHIISDSKYLGDRVISHKVKRLNIQRNLSLLRLLYDFQRFKKIIHEIKPDILHAMPVSNGLFGALLSFKPLIITGFGSEILIQPHKSYLKYLEIKYILSKATLSITESKITKRQMLRFQRIKNCEVIVFGVDKKIFNDNVPIKSLKDSLGITSENIILSPRSMIENSNIDQIIEAIPLVLEQEPQVVFIFKYNFGHLQPDMEKLVKRLGVNNNTRFIGYTPDLTSMPAYYNIATACVSIPSSDSTARAWFESIACGTPLILSDIPNTHEWFKHDENALIVPMKNPNILAKSIIEIIQNKELKHRLLDNGKRLLERKGNFNKNMKRMESLYNSVVNTDKQVL